MAHSGGFSDNLMEVPPPGPLCFLRFAQKPQRSPVKIAIGVLVLLAAAGGLAFLWFWKLDHAVMIWGFGGK